MKKLLILSTMILTLVLVGCGAKQVNYVSVMEANAKQYYEKYQTGVTGVDFFEISIANLKNANDLGGGKFDVKSLKNCKDSSYVIITIKKGTNVITKYDDHMNCE